MTTLRIALAFLRKDFLEEASYRLSFVFGVAWTFFTLIFFTWVSDFIGPLVEERLEPYGGNYFAFVILGLGVYLFLGAALDTLTGRIRSAQVLGTFEALLATRAPLPTILFCLPLYSFLQTGLRVLGLVVLGTLLFDMPLRWGNLPAAALLLGLTITAFGSMGLAVAGLTVAFKRTERINRLIGSLSIFLGGIYFPISVLPDWLADLARLLPITPGLEGLRIALLGGGSWSEILPHAVRLIAFIAVLLPFSALVFRWTLRRAMREGTLAQH